MVKKEQCEICGEKDEATLHAHHIVERTELNTSNDDMNTAVLCANCHNKLHLGTALKIIGVFPSTKPPGRMLIYTLNGICNVPGMENEKPYYIPKNDSMRWYNGKKDE